jgi:hypothetical protein
VAGARYLDTYLVTGPVRSRLRLGLRVRVRIRRGTWKHAGRPSTLTLTL